MYLANMKVDKDAAGRFIKAALSENEDNKGKKRGREELIVIESSSDDEKESKTSTKKKARLVMDPFAGKKINYFIVLYSKCFFYDDACMI